VGAAFRRPDQPSFVGAGLQTCPTSAWWSENVGIISLEGPVELIDGKLILRIPLDGGGRELAVLRVEQD
jgi:hypothetical protein